LSDDKRLRGRLGEVGLSDFEGLKVLMDTKGRLIAGSHNRNEFILINADEVARVSPFVHAFLIASLNFFENKCSIFAFLTVWKSFCPHPSV
jgi:hypothetical protein